jgi:hypothetical protein
MKSNRPGVDVLIFLVTLLLLGGCQPGREPAATPRPDGVEPRDVIIGADCPLPCWYGIVPGTSSDEDLLTVLHGLEFVDGATISRDSWSGKPGYESIVWDNTDYDRSNQDGIVYLDQNDIVETVIVRPHIPVTVEDFFSIAGEPDYFSVSQGADPYPRTFFVQFIWPSQGVSLIFWEARGSRRAQLVDSATVVTQIRYFAPQESIEDFLFEYTGASEWTIDEYLDAYPQWQGLEAVRYKTILENQEE